MADNEDVVKKAYANFGAGDMDGLKEMLTDDFVHHRSGTSQLAGDHKGPDAALASYAKMFEISNGSMRVELKSLESSGDKVIATHQCTAEAGGKKLDQEQVLTFTVRDGKLAHIDEEFADQDAYDDFWGR